MRCTECRDVLDAYQDHELMPDEAAAVKAHLAQCPDCAKAYDALLRTSHLLQAGLVHYPAPDVLKARIQAALAEETAVRSPAQPSQARWLRLAAAGLIIAVASSAGTFAAVHRSTDSLAATDEVLASHIRSLMPGHLIDVASNDQHNVKPWFNGRVDLSPQVPGLDTAGFALVGGRLDYLAGHRVAAVVYQRRQHLINVYSWPDQGPTAAPTTTVAHGYNFVRWRRENIEYWVVSDLNVAELSQFVGSFQRGAGSGDGGR
jgi:anti-sigma factor RsiW